MISVQRWLAKNNRCFELLEASGGQARTSITTLAELIRPQAERIPSLKAFAACRQEHKKLTRELVEHLCVTFVTPIEREDIGKLGAALNRVTKAAEKFAERYHLCPQHVAGWDLSRQLALLEKASAVVEEVVAEICQNGQVARVRELNTRLQQIEGEADRLFEATVGEVYGADEATVRRIVQMDLLEQLERVFDRCRSVGNIAYWTVLKNN